jgi:hypothetical protein
MEPKVANSSPSGCKNASTFFFLSDNCLRINASQYSKGLNYQVSDSLTAEKFFE